MAQWNQTDKTLQTKIVYWGAALCGKTTNLQQIHSITDPKEENRLISLNTASDRTLFFDLLPLDLGRVFGHTLKIQVYTVPGQVRYDATRRIVLSGADTVVFVADSQRGRATENRAAWDNLRTNLKVIGLDPSSIPVIVQYNKQDLPDCVTPREVEVSLQSGRQGIAASALQGAGVLETFRSAVLEMLKRLATISGRRRADDIAAIEEQVARTFERYSGRLQESVNLTRTTADVSRTAAGVVPGADARAGVDAGARAGARGGAGAHARADAGGHATGTAAEASQAPNQAHAADAARTLETARATAARAPGVAQTENAQASDASRILETVRAMAARATGAKQTRDATQTSHAAENMETARDLVARTPDLAQAAESARERGLAHMADPAPVPGAQGVPREADAPRETAARSVAASDSAAATRTQSVTDVAESEDTVWVPDVDHAPLATRLLDVANLPDMARSHASEGAAAHTADGVGAGAAEGTSRASVAGAKRPGYRPTQDAASLRGLDAGIPAAGVLPAEGLEQSVRLADSAESVRPADSAEGVRPADSAERDEPLPASQQGSPTTIRFTEEGAGEDLLVRSLRATLGIAEQFGEMREIKNRLARRVGELEGLQALVRDLSKRRDVLSIMVDLADAALSIPGGRAASLLTRNGEKGPLREALLKGLAHDPLMGERGTASSPAEEILRKGEPQLLEVLPIAGGSIQGDSGRIGCAMAVPLLPALRPAGLVVVYGTDPFSADDLRFLGLLVSHAAVCLDNAVMTERQMRQTERLEAEVRSRTAQLEQANERLRELDRMKDRFLSSVSHEMKTPLTGILSGTELLLTIRGEDDEAHEFISMIGAEAHRLSGLVDRILRFQVLGRTIEKGSAVSIEPFDMVSKIVMGLIEKASMREVEISVDMPQGLPTIKGDEEGVAIAIREVLDNAVKFSPHGGRVHVETREHLLRRNDGVPRGVRTFESCSDDDPSGERFLVVAVRDQGPGIPVADQARIFEKFEQVGDLLTAKPDGLGLGLSIAREVARRHGGDLHVHSESGAGSEFRLYLPVRTPQPRRDVSADALETAR